MTDGLSGLALAQARMRAAFRELRDAHDAIDRLAAIRTQRSWSTAEYDNYLTTAAIERRAMREYLKSRRAFDTLRRRILHQAATRG